MATQDKKSWETYFYVSTTDTETPTPGELTVTQSEIVVTPEDSDHTKKSIQYTDIVDITIGNPPPMMQREFHETINIKFNFESNDNPEICIIESNPNYNPLFSEGVFKKILSYTEVLFEFGAEKGGRTVESTTRKAKLNLSSEGLQFKTKNTIEKIPLGSIVKMQPEKREINGEHRDVLTLKHTHEHTVYTTHIAISNKNLMRLFRRYIKNTYGELLEEVKQLTVNDDTTELVVGLYTTSSIKQTANVIANGDKQQFKLIYNKAHGKGLVNEFGKEPILTQKGKLLANKQLENINK